MWAAAAVSWSICRRLPVPWWSSLRWMRSQVYTSPMAGWLKRSSDVSWQKDVENHLPTVGSYLSYLHSSAWAEAGHNSVHPSTPPAAPTVNSNLSNPRHNICDIVNWNHPHAFTDLRRALLSIGPWVRSKRYLSFSPLLPGGTMCTRDACPAEQGNLGILSETEVHRD